MQIEEGTYNQWFHFFQGKARDFTERPEEKSPFFKHTHAPASTVESE